MNKEDATQWHNSKILLISSDHSSLIDMLHDIGLDSLQVSTESETLQQLSKAAKNHNHYQLIFVEASVINTGLIELLKDLRVNPIFRLPIITIFGADNAPDDCKLNNANDWCELIEATDNKAQLGQVIEQAYQSHLAQKQDLINRLNKYNANILVVEDDNVNQQIFKLMLDSFSCQYDLVGTGHDALAKANQNNYDVVLLDIGLPDIDGFEVTKQLRDQGNDSEHLPVIAVTAFIPQKAISQCQEVGMNDVITKPVLLPGLQYAIACNLIAKI